jgi:hypothetical protein
MRTIRSTESILATGQPNEPRAMAPAAVWRSPPEALRLVRDEVHVWRAYLDRTSAAVQSLQHILSTDEWIRAGRFRLERDRRRFTAARGLLRVVLAGYLSIEPSQLRFRYGRYGKPSLAPAGDEEALSFSMSHSCGLALYAVTRGRWDQSGVSLAPGEPAKLLDHRVDPQEASHWSLREITLEPGLAATLAVEGRGWRLACR